MKRPNHSTERRQHLISFSRSSRRQKRKHLYAHDFTPKDLEKVPGFAMPFLHQAFHKRPVKK